MTQGCCLDCLWLEGTTDPPPAEDHVPEHVVRLLSRSDHLQTHTDIIQFCIQLGLTSTVILSELKASLSITFLAPSVPGSGAMLSWNITKKAGVSENLEVRGLRSLRGAEH